MKRYIRLIKSYLFVLIKNPTIKEKKVQRFLSLFALDKIPNLHVPNKISVGVIITVYGHEKYLQQCMSSLVNQTTSFDEIIIINDNSPDHSNNIIESFVSSFKDITQVKYISNKENIGQSNSINLAAENASSEYLMILNDDDILLPHASAIVRQLINAYPSCQLFGFNAIVGSSDDQINSVFNSEFQNLPQNIASAATIHKPEESRKIKYINGINMTHTSQTFSKQAWDYCGRYRAKKSERIVYAADRDFQLRVAYLFDILICDFPLSVWRNYSSVDKNKYS